jgi:hypothetical protein
MAVSLMLLELRLEARKLAAGASGGKVPTLVSFRKTRHA